MIVPITPATHAQIENPAFARYAARYLDIYEDFRQQVAATGVEIAADDGEDAVERKRDDLRARGARFRNGGRSIVLNRISPACVACKKGTGSATFFISLQCHRDCYYCFNPNQVEYDTFSRDRKRRLPHGIRGAHRRRAVAAPAGER